MWLFIKNYGASAIYGELCDHQTTATESQEKEIGVVGPKLTQKKAANNLWDINIHTLQDGGK